MRQALRDLLILHLGGLPTGPEVLEQVREILQTFLRGTGGDDPVVTSMRLQAQAMLERDPAVVFHDELSHAWQPFYLHEFAAHAGAHALEVLGDVEGMSLRQELFPTPLGEALRGFSGGDEVRYQQYQDFFNARLFHQSLLRHAGGPPALRQFDAGRVRALYAGAPTALEPPGEGDAPEEARFRFSKQAMIKVAEPEMKAALQRLGEAWPQFVPIAELEGSDTPEALAQLFTAGHVDLKTGPWPGLGGVAERPVGSPLARRQVALGLPYVTTLDMCAIKLEDPVGRAFLGLLDGTRDHAALAIDIAAIAGQSVEQAAPMVAPHLKQLAGMGLLME
jgi:hypothetical protein